MKRFKRSFAYYCCLLGNVNINVCLCSTVESGIDVNSFVSTSCANQVCTFRKKGKVQHREFGTPAGGPGLSGLISTIGLVVANLLGKDAITDNASVNIVPFGDKVLASSGMLLVLGKWYACFMLAAILL